MRTFTKVHEKRIARLTKRLMHTKTYNQRVLSNGDFPGCVMGHIKVEFGRLTIYSHLMDDQTMESYRKFLFGDMPSDPRAREMWCRDVFGHEGCGCAGRNGKKAARFIRKMAKDLKAAQT
jgi:hypothetical protein